MKLPRLPRLATHCLANFKDLGARMNVQFPRRCAGNASAIRFSTQRVDFARPHFFSLLIGYTVCDRSCLLLINQMFQISNAMRPKFYPLIIPHRFRIRYDMDKGSSLILGSSF